MRVFPYSMHKPARSRATGRVTLADVARAVRYLLEADFVTGEVLVVDGGRRLL